MIKITIKVLIDTNVRKVWDIISEIDNDPHFWKEIKKIKNISNENNVLTRKIIFYNNKICHQEITLIPICGIHIEWVKGIIIGTKNILLVPMGEKTLLEITMIYDFKGNTRLSPLYMAGRLNRETELAVQLIKNEAEKQIIDHLKHRTNYKNSIR